MSRTNKEVHPGFLALIVIVAATVFAWMASQIPVEPAYGQHTSLGAVEPVESTSKPTVFQGEWTDTDAGYVTYEASTSTGKWLAAEETFEFGKTGATTGALNMTGAVPCDTTTDNADGYVMSDSAYVTRIRCTNDQLVAVNDSLEVFVEGPTRIFAGAWTGTTEFFIPSNVVIPANKRFMVFIKSGSQNPTRPIVHVIVRRFVSQ